MQRFAPPVNGAVLVVERETGHVRTYVGSAGYLDAARKGAVNYLRARRSPGSTLKPLIYAAALDRRLITEHHVFDDRRLQRGGYAPANFDGTCSGAITLREALVQSRNMPAIEVLHTLGETTFENQLRSFLGSSVAQAEPAGLSLAVGGFHLTPEEIADLYLNLLDPTPAPRLRFSEQLPDRSAAPLATREAADAIQRLLAVTLPSGRIRVAKTGTSHGRQDALAVLVTRDHLIVVWFGTPDHEPTEILTGAGIALPFAERLQAALGLDDPVIVVRAADAEPAGVLVSPCPRLINYPEDGEWIRTAIIYLAALSTVDPELHEAAIVDGANRLRRILHVDIPRILPTIIVLLIIQSGQIMSVGFEKVFLMQTPLNLARSEIITTYVYKVGLVSTIPNYSYGAAVGLFNSVINLVLILAVNKLSKTVTNQSLW